MNEDGLHPLESILRLCAAAAPEPWYPRLFAKQEGVDRQELSRCLEELWQSGLIEKGKGDAENGPAISLTREGERVLLDPEASQRLRDGEPLSDYDRGARIRQALSGRVRPLVTRLLVALNLFVFAVCYYYTDKVGATNAFLSGSVTAPVAIVLDRCGLLSPRALLDQQWWRLLTTGFIHVGFMNLLMNAVALFFAGRFVEQLWGRLPYLTIYLVSLLGGNCLGVARGGGLIAGAAAGICGLLAAEALWFLFNRRYLPRDLRGQARTNAMMSVLLLAMILFFTNMNPWSDIGGAASGAIAAFLLQLHRFGPPPWRWLALAGFAPLVWYGHYTIERARLTNPEWQKVEDRYFESRFRPAVLRSAKKADEIYREKVESILEMHPERRDAAKVEEVLPILNEQQQELNAVAEQLAHAGPFGSPEAEEARQVGRDYVLSLSEWLAAAEHMLRIGKNRTDKDRRELRQQEQNVKDIRRKWNELFE